MRQGYDLEKVQKRLSKMGKTITDILEKHNIPYMITFGSLLGAVRHKGFIPWDDDFDLFLFADSYKNAIEFLRSNLPEDLFLEDEKSEPLYFHGWAHVKDLKSEAVCTEYPQDSLYSHHGLSVDLYVAKLLKECDLEKYVYEESLAYLERKRKHGFFSKTDFERKTNELLRKFKKLPKNDSEKKIFALNVPEKRMNYEDVFPLKKYEFDEYLFYGPNNADNILKQFYGDYMKLPPVEKRISHYSEVIFHA